MEHKSLRQLAKELGVSHSYLSQVQHGKRPASQRVVSGMVSSGKQNKLDLGTKFGRTYNLNVFGSNPTPVTKINKEAGYL